jgi:Fur family zinc uptake transcriptional regulator
LSLRSNSPSALDQFPAPGHNHGACTRAALEAADRLCEANNARFTAMRRTVLQEIWHSHKPITAYDLLANLNAKGAKHAPVAVYRALDFLLTQGLIHKLSSLNAFIGCTHPEATHDARFLICRSCHSVAELTGKYSDEAFNEAVARTGFYTERKIIEVSGTCRFCANMGGKKGARAGRAKQQ